jgi:type VI secretion system (T6SS) baseplate-like injector VgrG
MPDLNAPTRETGAESRAGGGGTKHFGKYRGVVSNNADPKNLGRIKARVPALDNIETGWAMPCVPYAGDGIGSFLVPPADSRVWIEFEAGNVSTPIWVGCWWAEDQLPKNESNSSTTPPMKIVRTEKGLMLCIDDAAETITLSDSGGGNLLKIKASQGEIRVQAKSTVIVEAPLIDLVDNATHPLVFGDSLLNYLNQLVMLFNTHVHPGQLAAGVIPVTPCPPAGPFPAATISLLSSKVKTG